MCHSIGFGSDLATVLGGQTPPSLKYDREQFRATAPREKAGMSALVLSSHQRLLHCFP